MYFHIFHFFDIFHFSLCVPTVAAFFQKFLFYICRLNMKVSLVNAMVTTLAYLPNSNATRLDKAHALLLGFLRTVVQTSKPCLLTCFTYHLVRLGSTVLVKTYLAWVHVKNIGHIHIFIIFMCFAASASISQQRHWNQQCLIYAKAAWGTLPSVLQHSSRCQEWLAPAITLGATPPILENLKVRDCRLDRDFILKAGHLILYW